MAHISELIETDIDAYLEAHHHKSLLRFITCGSVDDGKSTLIGRLLYDSKMIFEDQLAALEADSRKVGTQGGKIDFALLDVNLDGDTSFGAAEVLRARGVPFAFVTGYGEQGVRSDLRDAPILSKPIDPRHLARIIGDVDRS